MKRGWEREQAGEREGDTFSLSFLLHYNLASRNANPLKKKIREISWVVSLDGRVKSFHRKISSKNKEDPRSVLCTLLSLLWRYFLTWNSSGCSCFSVRRFWREMKRQRWCAWSPARDFLCITIRCVSGSRGKKGNRHAKCGNVIAKSIDPHPSTTWFVQLLAISTRLVLFGYSLGIYPRLVSVIIYPSTWTQDI